MGAVEALKGLGQQVGVDDFLPCYDVIEHLPKDIGVQVIEECERVSSEQIVMFTSVLCSSIWARAKQTARDTLVQLSRSLFQDGIRKLLDLLGHSCMSKDLSSA